MYKIEKMFCFFLNEALSDGHSIIHQVDDGTGYLLQDPLPAPVRLEQYPSTRHGDPFKRDPGREDNVKI